MLSISASVSALTLGDNGYDYYVIGDGAEIPILYFDSTNDGMLYVNNNGLTIWNDTTNWFRLNSNDTAGGNGGSFVYSDWFDQKLNKSDTPQHITMYIDDYIEHSGDANTNMQFLSDAIWFTTGGNARLYLDGSNEEIGIGTATPSRFLDLYDTNDDIFLELETDKTNGNIGLLGINDAKQWQLYMPDSSNDFRLREAGSNNVFIFRDGTNSNAIVTQSSQIFMWSTSGSAGKEVDVNGDHEATSYNPTSDPRVKDFIMYLKSKPNKLRIFGENVSYSLFKWKEDPIGNFTVNNDGYGIGIDAYELADWFNETFNPKYLSAVVTLGNSTTLSSVNYDNILGILIEYVKIEITDLKERVTILEELI